VTDDIYIDIDENFQTMTVNNTDDGRFGNEEVDRIYTTAKEDPDAFESSDLEWVLEEMWGLPDDKSRRYASKTIEEIAGSRPEMLLQWVEEISDLVSDGDRWVRFNAASALAKRQCTTP
jgi:hypothetical protein